jgi:hypothetical protein
MTQADIQTIRLTNGKTANGKTQREIKKHERLTLNSTYTTLYQQQVCSWSWTFN